MLLDRHQLFQLAAYANAYAAGTPPAEDDVRMFLRIAYDDASGSARERFLAGVDEERWPQSAIEVRTWTSAGQLVRGAPPVEHAPLALVLLAGRDENDPASWHSPLAYVPEPVFADDLRAGRLVVVLEAYAATVPGYFIYYPSRAQRSPPLALFVACAKELLAGAPGADAASR